MTGWNLNLCARWMKSIQMLFMEVSAEQGFQPESEVFYNPK